MANNAGIIGYGYYVPERIVSNYEIARRFEITENWIEERTGIRERRKAENDICTSELAIKAANTAMRKANILSEEIDLIIVATSTPDMLFLSTACLVQNKIGAYNAAAFDISAACTGFIYGLDIAASLVSSGKQQKILLIGADTLSRITNDNDLDTSILFGDGAGAVIIGEVPPGFGMIESIKGSDGSGADLLKVPAGGFKQPITHDLLDSSSSKIVMNGKAIFQFAVKIIEKVIEQITIKAGIAVNDISLIIPHQANKRILHAVSERMKLSKEQLFCNIEYYGNMSSASIPVALTEACNNNKVKKGDILLLLDLEQD
jgi:3-oxoacyl-[acyl-carrier-protein] synthase-3